MGKLLFLVVVIVCLYYVFGWSTPPPPTSKSVPATLGYTEPGRSSQRSSRAYRGSGHQAGFDWAQEKGISVETDCEAAGEHSNSPSFAEGCAAYVRGESEP